MTFCYPPFIGRLAFAAVDGELHSNSSGFILFFRNNRVGFGGSFYIGSVIQKRKKRRAICPQPLELPFPALHSLFVFFPVDQIPTDRSVIHGKTILGGSGGSGDHIMLLGKENSIVHAPQKLEKAMAE